MEAFIIVIALVFVLVLLFATFSVKTGSPAPINTQPEHNSNVEQDKELERANQKGRQDMRNALHIHSKNQLLNVLEELAEENKEDAEFVRTTKGLIEHYSNHRPGNSDIADRILMYERLTNSVFMFDPIDGQDSPYYLATDDTKLFSEYVKGGMELLDSIDTEKAKVLESRQRIDQRKAGLQEINRRWQSANVELTKLRNKEIESIDDKDRFDELLYGEDNE